MRGCREKEMKEESEEGLGRRAQKPKQTTSFLVPAECMRMTERGGGEGGRKDGIIEWVGGWVGEFSLTDTHSKNSREREVHRQKQVVRSTTTTKICVCFFLGGGGGGWGGSETES